MKRIIFSFSFFLFFILVVYSTGQTQEIRKFSLKEAQLYALENNYDVKNALTDIEIAKKKVKENLAIGFPQVNASANYNNNIELPTTLIPGEFFGAPGEDMEIQFGTQHNAAWGADLNQIIFSGEYIVGVMASKSYVGLIETNYEKSEIEIKDAISKAYYPVIILQENKKVFDSTLSSLNDMLYDTEEYYKSGFVEDTDVDQLKLLISDMETTITNIDNQLEIAYNMLKYQMGIKAEEDIEITDKLEDVLAEVNRTYLLNTSFDYNNHIDYKILKSQEEMALLQLKLNKSEYFPSLVGFYSYQQNAMRDKFNFFASDKKWFTNQMLGVQLNVPILSSGNRKNKVAQAKLNLEKIKVMDDQLQQGLSLKVKTKKSEFNNAYMIYVNKKTSISIAENIYNKTKIKYREGLSTSLDLSQTYNQYLNTQIQYLASILDLLIKKSELEKELTKVNY
ncbi:MAG: hypothetical protein B6D61_06565 [Bacteroidetes bacterium 4484_249]|nr:MAG: hypothetical protein B6D61_06565 [Bacteroidetes bacterium 4484_249]